MSESHDHGRPDVRCMECITDQEWELISDAVADRLADATNHFPAHAIWIDLSTGDLYSEEEDR